MLHDIYTQVRRGRQSRGRDRTRYVDPQRARFNPWLRWRPEQPVQAQVLTVADMAECRCPDLCNRDHANE